jgi:hypothetical protein
VSAVSDSPPQDAATEYRLAARRNGYDPLPIKAGTKRPPMDEWTKLRDQPESEIARWPARFPNSPGTGLLLGRIVMLDADIPDAPPAQAAWDLIYDMYEGKGVVLRRTGQAPKFAVPFRTPEPYSKVKHQLTSPTGKGCGIEILCDGQQSVVDGIHPDTGKPYEWLNGVGPDTCTGDRLPELSQTDAEALLDLIGNMLVERFGFIRGTPKTNGHAAGSAAAVTDVAAEAIECPDYAAQLLSATGDVNRAQSRRIFSLLNRGEHPDEVEQIVLGETLASKAWDSRTWTEKREIAKHIRPIIRSDLRKLNGEYLQDTGEVPSWLHGDFHPAWCRIIADGGWPALMRPGHTCVVVDTKPKAGDTNRRAVPLTAEEWLERKLPPFDYLMGDWLTTTRRILFSADTGIGKSSLWLAVLAYTAAGAHFLHWRSHRPARALFIDGEMSRRWLQKMVHDATRRLGTLPPTLFIFSREDYPNMPPLNTPEGKAFILAYIESIGGVDVVCFDNLMSLLVGELKEPSSWQSLLELVAELSRRCIGQVWINHTGHDAGKSYGDKTRDWRMTSTIHLTKIERPDTDVSFD